jgi:hypothetical protein
MRSALEIAQSASLRDIRQIAASAGIEEYEFELYARYKATIDLSILKRLEGRPRRPLHHGDGDHPHAPWRWEDRHQHLTGPRPRPAREESDQHPAPALDGLPLAGSPP